MVNIDSLLQNPKWQVFKGPYPTEDKYHRCIILNTILENNIEVVYFYMTSKVEKISKIMKYDKKALVIIEPKDWAGKISVQTAIQCDKMHLFKIPLDELKNKMKSGKVKILGKLPSDIIRLIKTAIVRGKTFSPEERTFLTKEK